MSVSFSASDHRNTTQTLRSDGLKYTRYASVELPETWQFFNWSNGNARLVLNLLGFSGDDLYGEATIVECRRAVMRARSRNAEQYTRPEEIVYDAPRVNEDGTVELRPVRVYSFGLDAPGVCERMEAFAAFVEVAAKLGATHIHWG
jgi:hypothetical protein